MKTEIEGHDPDSEYVEGKGQTALTLRFEDHGNCIGEPWVTVSVGDKRVRVTVRELKAAALAAEVAAQPALTISTPWQPQPWVPLDGR